MSNSNSIQKEDNFLINLIVYVLVTVFIISSFGLEICLQILGNIWSLGSVGALAALGLWSALEFLPNRFNPIACILITAFVSFISTGVGIFIAFMFL